MGVATQSETVAHYNQAHLALGGRLRLEARGGAGVLGGGVLHGRKERIACRGLVRNQINRESAEARGSDNAINEGGIVKRTGTSVVLPGAQRGPGPLNLPPIHVHKQPVDHKPAAHRPQT